MGISVLAISTLASTSAQMRKMPPVKAAIARYMIEEWLGHEL